MANPDIHHYYDSSHLQHQSIQFHHPNSFIAALQIMHNNIENNVSDHACEKYLKIEQSKAKISSYEGGSDYSGQIPNTLRTLKNRFSIQANIHKKVCCPHCYALYPLEEVATGDLNRIQTENEEAKIERCSTVNLGNYGTRTPCNTNLLNKDKHKNTLYPTKMFFHQMLKEWLAVQLHRPNFEEYLDASHDSGGKTYQDIWDGELWKISLDQISRCSPNPRETWSLEFI